MVLVHSVCGRSLVQVVTLVDQVPPADSRVAAVARLVLAVHDVARR